MIRPIVVAGSTGKTGRVVVDALLEASAPVRAIVRGRDERSRALEARGVEVVVSDLHDYATLVLALRNASAAYYIPPWGAQAVTSAAAFAAAARDAGLPAIVELSQWLSSPVHPSFYTRAHWLITRMFQTLPGIAHVTLNPGFFADNLLISDILQNAAHFGMYFWASPRGMLNAPPSNEDIGRVAAALLLDPQPHAGCSYRPTGPALITGDDVVATLSKLLKRRVTMVSPPRAILRKALAAAGNSAGQRMDAVTYFSESTAWSVDAPNDIVRRFTGRDAEDFETIARRYIVANPALRPTFANRLAALAAFTRVAFTAGGSDAAYLRAAEIVPPTSTRLSSDSPEWLEAHLPREIAAVRPYDLEHVS